MAVARMLPSGCPLPNANLRLVENLNPDGFRRGTRLNARGVDLNRNFPSGWRPGGQAGDLQYSGPRPFSEPETRIARRLIESYRRGSRSGSTSRRRRWCVPGVRASPPPGATHAWSACRSGRCLDGGHRAELAEPPVPRHQLLRGRAGPRARCRCGTRPATPRRSSASAAFWARAASRSASGRLRCGWPALPTWAWPAGSPTRSGATGWASPCTYPSASRPSGSRVRINGRPVRMRIPENVPTKGIYFEGFLRHAGLDHGALDVTTGHPVFARVSITATYPDGSWSTTTRRVGLAPGWG